MPENLLEKIGFVASIVLPLWNIPLVWRIVKRKSSKDISVSWALGVWCCILLMAPNGLASKDMTFKAFTIMNLIFFTMVVLATVIYRKGNKNE